METGKPRDPVTVTVLRGDEIFLLAENELTQEIVNDACRGKATVLWKGVYKMELKRGRAVWVYVDPRGVYGRPVPDRQIRKESIHG